MDSSYDLVKNWLTNSGIFVSDSSNPNYGGVRSFYDEKKKEFAFLYPEITGYFVSSMRFLYEHEKNAKYIELAKSSSLWLIQLYEKFGGIIQGISQEGTPKKLVYSFDTGVCAKGLLDCYSITKEEKFLEYGKKLNQWLVDEAINPNGFVKPLKNLETNEFETSNDVWYKQPGCLHVKLAIPLLQLYKINHDDNMLESAKKISDNIINFQNPDGSLRLHQDNKTINLHALCYALEGLIVSYYVTKNESYLNHCKKALHWCDDQISKDGSIELWFNSKYHEKASYPIAQIIRLKLLLAKIDPSNHDEQVLEKLKSFLLTLQTTNNESPAKGGFYEEYYKSVLGWKKRLRINSWGSMFALQALYWQNNYPNFDFDKEIELLY